MITEANNESVIQVLDHYYTNDVCLAETTEEMNELLAQKTGSNEN